MNGIKEGISAGTWPFTAGVQEVYRKVENGSKQVYTLTGIAATDDYRSIVIDNGKKYLRK
jgi:hypothetical protein